MAGRDLDGERQAVHGTADGRHVLAVPLAVEVWVDGGADLLEQGDRVSQSARTGAGLDGEWLDVEHTLAGDAQTSPARDQDPKVVRPLDHLGHQAGGIRDVLEVVEHEEQRLPAQGFLEHRHDVLTRPGADAELAHHELGDQTGLAHLGQVHEAPSLGSLLGPPLGHLGRQPGLADTADAQQCHDLMVGEHGEDASDVAFPSDRRRRRPGEPGPPASERPVVIRVEGRHGLDLGAKGLRGLARPGAQLLPPGPLHGLEMSQGAASVPVQHVLMDQPQVCLLVEGLGGDEVGPPLGRAEHLDVSHAKALPLLVGPLLVAVVGQQVPAVELERLLGTRDVTVGPVGVRGLLEGVHVDDDLCVGEQRDHVARQHHAARTAQGRPRVVGGLVQARRSLREIQVRPQEVDQLFAVQPPSRAKREELDQRCRTAAPPGIVRDGQAVDGN